MDVGCGELTQTQALFGKLDTLDHFFACDISFSRCLKGLDFYKDKVNENTFENTKVFVGEMLQLPLPDNSIDIIFTAHAMEPNRGNEDVILAEFLRVAKKGLVLIEPSYELANDEQKQRMDLHGFIKGLPDTIHDIKNAKLLQNELTNIYSRELNRPASFIIKKMDDPISENNAVFVDPVSKTELTHGSNYFFSPVRGVTHPIIENIPILRPSVEVINKALRY